MATKSAQPTPMRPGQPTGALKPEERERLIAEAAARKAAESQQTTAPRTRITAPWQDLEPTTDKPAIPRDKTVFAQALACIEEHRAQGGATLEEIKESFRALPGQGPDQTMYHHDPKTLLTWQNRNRGWGFRMDPKTQRISVWSK